MCETDFSGYPDCRDATLRALEQAIRLGTEIPFTIETPLMWLTKADTWALAEELGGEAFVDSIIEETHTCYRGERGVRHEWGYGCGVCPAVSSAPKASPRGRPRAAVQRSDAGLTWSRAPARPRKARNGYLLKLLGASPSTYLLQPLLFSAGSLKSGKNAQMTPMHKT